MPNMLNAAQAAEFAEKGFTYARGLFAPDEVKLLTEAMEKDPAVRGSVRWLLSQRLPGSGWAGAAGSSTVSDSTALDYFVAATHAA